MSLTLCKISKNKKISVKQFVEDYLSLLPEVFEKSKRDNWLFVKGVGSLGLAYQGQVKTVNKENFSSETVVIGGKQIALVRYLITDKIREINSLRHGVKKSLSEFSPFILLEHTGKWEMYKGRKWLTKYAPPRKTPQNNIFFPQGTISAYFGFGKDEKGVYQKEKRGIKFVKEIGKGDYNSITSFYYGRFLDNNNLEGLASRGETGLRHFTMGIYEKNSLPVIFGVRSKTIISNPVILKTNSLIYLCSSRLFLKALCKKSSILIRNILPGDIYEYSLEN